ncbi:MAG: tetratricopeptide repeat protein [Pseudomonadota bacterium]
MPRLYLHIGPWKTGTTSIQDALYAHRALLADRYGVNYPAVRPNHWIFAIPFHTDPDRYIAERPGQYVAAKRREMAAMAGKFAETVGAHPTHVLSAEQFFTLDEGSVERMRAFFDRLGLDTQVIAYARSPIDQLPSIVNQIVRTGGGRLSEVLGRLPITNLKHHLSVFVRVFGQDRVSVRKFSRAALVGGDAVTDFLSAIGITDPGGEIQRPNTNKALSAPAMLIADQLTAVAPKGSKDRGPVGYLETIAGPRFDVPQEIAARIAEAFAPHNAYLAEQHGISFSEEELQPNAMRDDGPLLLDNALAASLAATLNRQSLEIRAQRGRIAFLEGLSLLSRQQPEQARARFIACLQHAPDTPQAHFELARLLWDAGETETALQHAEEALRLSPASAQFAALKESLGEGQADLRSGATP